MPAPLFLRQTTSWGGRGVFATQPIPSGTLVHTCPIPYASVIYREFRKEVCAQCFAYAFDARKNAWNVRAAGLWFCTEGCRDVWMSAEPVALIMEVNAAIDKVARSLKTKGERTVLIPKESLSQDALDAAWESAEHTDVALDELELETVRFVLSALIRRHTEQDTEPVPGNTWADALELQDNELPCTQSRPFILASHLRVYAFIRRVARLVPVLAPYITSVRPILARDPGNVFGIYEMNETGDSEMFGWSMYVSASFFNHDCRPNIRKQRAGRSICFYTTRDVALGEELCTSYVDLENGVQERRAQLASNWYFDCVCERCKTETERRL
ncbi:Protein lysine methyltransferase [Mycena kentingensis (nom. inval.)]|nr:Protein lysine methyltransferase [Mycena kentingensis (nom. inval.)]